METNTDFISFYNFVQHFLDKIKLEFKKPLNSEKPGDSEFFMIINKFSNTRPITANILITYLFRLKIESYLPKYSDCVCWKNYIIQNPSQKFDPNIHKFWDEL